MSSKMSSPPSSSSESCSPPTPSSSLQNFNPFAEHPFTNCSHVNQNGQLYNSPSYSYGGAHPMNHNNRYNALTTQVVNHPSPSNFSQSSPTPYGYQPGPTAIFEQFRKETSSPELNDILKPNKSPGKVSNSSPDFRFNSSTYTSSTSGTVNAAKPIPILPNRKF